MSLYKGVTLVCLVKVHSSGHSLPDRGEDSGDEECVPDGGAAGDVHALSHPRPPVSCAHRPATHLFRCHTQEPLSVYGGAAAGSNDCLRHLIQVGGTRAEAPLLTATR